MEATLTIGVIKNCFWSLRNVNSPAAPKLSALRSQLNSKGSIVVAAFFGLRFFAVSD